MTNFSSKLRQMIGIDDTASTSVTSDAEGITPPEEREAIKEMALEDLRARGAGEAGPIEHDAETAAMLRDQALQEHLARRDRIHREVAERQQRQPQPASGVDTSEPVAPARDDEAFEQVHEDVEEEEEEFEYLEDVLAEVPGLGPAKVQRVMDVFPTFEDLYEADVEDLTELKGIGSELAKEILRAVQ